MRLGEAIKNALAEFGKGDFNPKDRMDRTSITYRVYAALRDGPSPGIVCDGILNPHLKDDEPDFVRQQIAKMIAENSL